MRTGRSDYSAGCDRKKNNNTLPHDIFYCASSSIDPSAHPAVGPDWELRGLHLGTRPTQLEAALWLPTGGKKQKQQTNTSI